jgi:hypothetical protein
MICSRPGILQLGLEHVASSTGSSDLLITQSAQVGRNKAATQIAKTQNMPVWHAVAANAMTVTTATNPKARCSATQCTEVRLATKYVVLSTCYFATDDTAEEIARRNKPSWHASVA